MVRVMFNVQIKYGNSMIFKNSLSASWLVRELSNPRLDWPRVGLSANCPVSTSKHITDLQRKHLLLLHQFLWQPGHAQCQCLLKISDLFRSHIRHWTVWSTDTRKSTKKSSWWYADHKINKQEVSSKLTRNAIHNWHNCTDSESNACRRFRHILRCAESLLNIFIPLLIWNVQLLTRPVTYFQSERRWPTLTHYKQRI